MDMNVQINLKIPFTDEEVEQLKLLPENHIVNSLKDILIKEADIPEEAIISIIIGDSNAH